MESGWQQAGREGGGWRGEEQWRDNGRPRHRGRPIGATHRHGGGGRGQAHWHTPARGQETGTVKEGSGGFYWGANWEPLDYTFVNSTLLIIWIIRHEYLNYPYEEGNTY